jgi:hypothetical protein
MKKNFSKAFSLIELSIIIVVIGVLIAGTISGVDLIKKSKLATARALTESSPVVGINGLKIWVETTLDKAVIPATNLVDEDIIDDKALITTWNDINPQSKTKYNLTGLTVNRPSYKKYGINDLPTINFTPNSYFIIPNCQMFNNGNYTVFIVDMLTEAAIVESDFNMALIGGRSVDANTNASTNITLTYRYTTADKYSQIIFNGGTYNYNFNNYAPHIHTLRFDNNKYDGSTYETSSDYWLDGGDAIDALTTTGRINNCYQAWLGGDTSKSYYKGYISELIIFNKALTDEERKAIEEYLGKKYKIQIN